MKFNYYLLIKRLLVVIFPFTGFILFFLFDGWTYFNLDKINIIYNKANYYVNLNEYKSICIYMLMYSLSVVLSIPIKPLFKIMGGLLFGLWIGFIAALISATVGAMLVFICVKYSWKENSIKSKSIYITKFESLVKNNPVSMLLIARLVPIPFFIPNILAGILKIKTNIFLLTTLIGIIPITFVYVWLGTRVNKALISDDIYKLINWKLLVVCSFLVLLSLLPLLFKQLKKYLNKRF